MRDGAAAALTTAMCQSGCYKVFNKQTRRWVCVRCGN